MTDTDLVKPPPFRRATRRPVIRSTTIRYRPTVSNTRPNRRRVTSTTTTTSKPEDASSTALPTRNFSRFPSRKPFFRLTTIGNLDRAIKNYNTDQTVQPTDSKPLESIHDDTTKLGELATVLSQLQHTPIRPKSSGKSYSQAGHQNLVSSELPLSKAPIVYLPSTTQQPVIYKSALPQVYPPAIIIKQEKPKPFEKIVEFEDNNKNYDYYDEGVTRFVQAYPQHGKVLLHPSGIIQCLDQGNFPHPSSCRKFIYCAKVDSGDILGWEYTCARNLSFDPIGGICNWAAGLGCHE